MSIKELRFVGTSLVATEAKRAAEFELAQVQNGVGAGIREIWIRSGAKWRVLYVAKFIQAVFVLHASGKKAPRTAQSDIEMAVKRYAEVAKRRSPESSSRPAMCSPTRISAGGSRGADVAGRTDGGVAQADRDPRRDSARAAEEFGVTQSRMSDLVRGKHEKFSPDMLVTLASRAGRTVELRLAA